MARLKIDGVWSSKHPLYPAWASMIARCEQPSCFSFKYYGPRGIKVCARWRSSFAAFVADMGPKPTPDYSLDRIDPDGDYTPDNCRWTDAKTQSRNRRVVKPITIHGVTYPTQSAAAAAFGINKGDLSRRLKAGMPPEDAVKKREPITVHGKQYPSIKAAAEAHGISHKTAHIRLKTGWPLEEAVTAPVWKYRHAPKASPPCG